LLEVPSFEDWRPKGKIAIIAAVAKRNILYGLAGFGNSMLASLSLPSAGRIARPCGQEVLTNRDPIVQLSAAVQDS